MRDTNRIIEIVNVSTIKTTAVKEEIVTIVENKISKTITVFVNAYDSNDKIIKNESYQIDSANYDLLMSGNPTFAPNKPSNEYREVDLWYFIDLIRNG